MGTNDPAYINRSTPHRNVHVVRWEGEAEKRSTPELVELYGRLPSARGRFTARQSVVRRELERRGESLRDLGIDPPRTAR